jgi:hypothetical protein
VSDARARISTGPRITLHATIYPSSDALVFVDQYPGGMPMLVLRDGSTEVAVLPYSATPTRDDIAHAELLLSGVREYTEALKTTAFAAAQRRP